MMPPGWALSAVLPIMETARDRAPSPAFQPRIPAENRSQNEGAMSNHTYKLVEIVGSSPEGTDKAIRNAIAKASETIKHIDWFEVVETRGHVVNDGVAHFQVTLKIGFRVD